MLMTGLLNHSMQITTPKKKRSNGGNFRLLGKRSVGSVSVDGADGSSSLCSEGLANVFNASVLPTLHARLAEGEQDTVVRSVDPILDAGRWSADQDVDIGGQFTAVVVERKIVDVVAEGVLNLGATKKGSV